ncbi:MAG: hypothetical protein IKL84_06580, partial [Clostridia bacterium]|nr:hypothetical protein [Clostridia bacterium]
MKKNLIPAILLCLLCFVACAPGNEPPDAGYTLPVILQLPEGGTVAGEPRVDALPGGDASFAITLSPGYTLIVPDGCSYADGILTLHDVRYPTTLSPVLQFDPGLIDPGQTLPGQSYTFSLAEQTPGGKAQASHPAGLHPVGTEITVCATPDEGQRFVCWSVGGAVGEGGVPVSLTGDYRFPLGMPMTLCANFAPADTATILYDTNGGSAAGTGYTFLREDSDLRNYYTPRT